MTTFVSLWYYFAPNAIVIFGVFFGIEFVSVCKQHPDSQVMNVDNIAERFAPWDGVWFRRIAADGYSYDPERMSSVAFYPLYPIAGRTLSIATGLSIEQALLLTSHLFLAGSFVLFGWYLQQRNIDIHPHQWAYTLVAFGIFPTTFYFRMSYTESTFLFTILLAVLAMQRRMPLLVIALLVGVSTAARPVGIAVILPFLLHVWQLDRSLLRFSFRACFLLPFCVWGIVSYMAYQYFAFGDAFAFMKTQVHWYERMPPPGIFDKIIVFFSLESFWSTYDPNCVCYWQNAPPLRPPLFNMYFMNPIFVILAWVLIAYGVFKKWLTHKEVLLCVGLFAIPYLTHAYRGCMSSEARYASVAFPCFIVLGSLLSRMPLILIGMFSAVSSILLAVYSAMFVNWYWFF